LIYEESGMNFVLLLCIQLFFAWTHQITIYTSKSADQIFINVYISSKLQILSVMMVHITF